MIKKCPCSAMDRASGFGPEGWGFESLQGRIYGDYGVMAAREVVALSAGVRIPLVSPLIFCKAMSSKTLKIFLFLFLLSLIALISYNLFLRNKQIIINRTNKISPILNQPRLKLILPKPIISSFQINQKYLLAATTNGSIFQFDFSSQKLKQIKQLKVPSAEKFLRFIWSPRIPKQGIAIIQDNNQKIKKYFFDLTSNQLVPLSSHIQWIDFSPDGKQIIYQYFNPSEKESFISLAKPNGQSWENTISTRLRDLSIYWGNGETVTFYSQSPRPSSLFSLNIISHQINQLLAQQEKIEVVVSPFKEDALVSVLDPKEGVKLYFINLKTRQKKLLQIKTFAHKCVFATSEKIYCAIPQYIPKYHLLSPLMSQNKLFTQDNILLINLFTGQTEKILPSSEDNIDIQEIKISSSQKYLFFIGHFHRWLYQLRI